ncbi:MAG: dehydrogenase E1 component subunit alpha/beta [Planctomycetes bacterium]|nr:dehydrogenase E1 component subunit alpha/beta [Planctomycetota bacterium]
MGKLRNVATRRGGDLSGVAEHRGTALQLEQLVAMFRVALLSRTVDEAESRVRKQGKTYFHISSAGHEVLQAAAAQVLRPGYDWFYPYYRDRCLNLGLGVQPVDLFLASYGKATDPATGGREMPCHFGTPSLRIVNRSSATGSQFLHAVGTAEGILLARQGGLQPGNENDRGGVDASRVEDDEIVLVTGGDGATSEGEFYEAISAACLKRLPVLFVIEDNSYAISVPVEYQTPGGNISRILRSFPDLRVVEMDGLDAVESLTVMESAVAHVRGGHGPALVHAHVCRLASHSDADDDRLYRSAEERKQEKRRDPIPRLEQLLVDEGRLSKEELIDLRRRIKVEVDEALDIAAAGPDPDGAHVTEHLFESTIVVSEETRPVEEGPEITMVEAIARTLQAEMRRDGRILVFGEDVADASRSHVLDEVPGKGGVFRVTHGLQTEFGSNRVFNTPIAEAAIVGRSVGLSVRGFLPVAEIQFFDYIWPAMHQIRNELSVLRWRSNNNFPVPVVLRVPIGGYLRGGAIYHSQSGESIFCSCPGIRVVFPSNARDAAGLLRTSIRCGDPVLFLEHKHLYRQLYAKTPDPGPDYAIPLGKARLVRKGSDVTVVTYGALVEKSLEAARVLEEKGVDVEILDLRTLQPFDWEAIANSVMKTSRVIVAAEESKSHGFGAEIAARIGDELFSHLDAPVRRIGALDVPVPYAPVLEAAMLPSVDWIVSALDDLLSY